jgi:hypothetical protein
MRAIVMISVILMVSFAPIAWADEAEQQLIDDNESYETFYQDLEFLGPNYDLVHEHWIDGCQVTIKLSDAFEPTDAECQSFGDLVLYIFEMNPEVCLVYVVPDEHGWVPSAQNPIDYGWARCLADESYCPSTAATIGDPDPFDNLPTYPSRPIPVVVQESDDGGGCFIQTVNLF